MNECLDGKTLLRFSYSLSEGGGGLEQYLSDLDHGLIHTTRMTIIHVCLTKINDTIRKTIEQGRAGTLINISIPHQEGCSLTEIKSLPFAAAIDRFRGSINEYLRNFSGISFILQRLKRAVNRATPPSGGYDFDEFRKMIIFTFDKYPIDLIMIHAHDIFEADQYLMRESIRRKIPFALQIHYHNKLLNLLSIRENVRYARGVAGVSDQNVPRYIRDKFHNLSDGVDIHFYKKDMPEEKNLGFKEPLVFLPARMATGKGHLDLIKAALIMKSNDISFKIICAGRCDMPDFEYRIREFLRTKVLSDFFILLPHLSREKLRNVYAQSRIVVLPSRSEGLGRVLLEAQAMRIPVIAYNTGGVVEALRNNETGYLVRKGDYRSLAKRIMELLADEKKRGVMGTAGREYIEKYYSVEAMVERHKTFYGQMMQK